MAFIRLSTLALIVFSVCDVIRSDTILVRPATQAVQTKPVVTDDVPDKRPIDFEKAKTEIVRNIRNQYRVLRNLTDGFKEVFAAESEQAQGMYKNLTKSLSWYFTEPDDEETARLDRQLSALFPFGGRDEDFVDSLAAMELYCSQKERRLDALKSWVRRKYRYNMIVQVALSMIVSKIESKNEFYCKTTAHKQDFVRHMQRARQINSRLMETKDRFLDAAIFIQNSEYQLPKVGRLCCAFWAFFRQLTENTRGTDSLDFVVDMTKHYFSSATRYVCFLYPYGSELCEDEEPCPRVPHKYQSVLLEMVLTLGEIAAP